MNTMTFRTCTSVVGAVTALTLILCCHTGSLRAQPRAEWGAPAPTPPAPFITPGFPYAGAPWTWMPSLHVYEYNTGRTPNIALHLRSSSGLLGTSQWGVALGSSMFSSLATSRDVVLNASEAEDLIITNLSGTFYTGVTNVGAIRFGTAPADGSTTIPADIERMTILNNGNVGVNQSGPVAKFQVTDGAVLFNGTTGGTPVSGGGTRFMWIPAKGALRAGTALGSEWNDANIGSGSVALGLASKASGISSFAIGDAAQATSTYDVAFGRLAHATGGNSLALGHTAQAAGASSIAIGPGTADGDRSVAIATLYNAVTAEAYGSVAIGGYNILDAGYSRTSLVATDPIFMIGNGTSTSLRSNAMTVLWNGNVGIGDHEPTTTRLLVKSSGDDDQTNALEVRNTNGDPLLLVRDDGFVGIGTEPCVSETFKLKVDGHIKAKEIVVETDAGGWCDYVFEEGYELMPLKELDAEIERLGHLPGIPSSEEVEEHGVNVSIMQAKLLLKIEELTLYVIEQEKRLTNLEEENRSLRLQVEAESATNSQSNH